MALCSLPGIPSCEKTKTVKKTEGNVEDVSDQRPTRLCLVMLDPAPIAASSSNFVALTRVHSS